MGRNAKLRKQRKSGEAKGDASQTTKSSCTSLSTVRTEVPLASDTAASQSESTQKKPGFFGKLFSRFSSSGTKTRDPSVEASEFFLEYEETLAAIAWKGYKNYGRGVVFAHPSDQPAIQIEYVPRKLLKKYTAQNARHIDFLSDMLEEYDPPTGLLAVYLHPSGETIATPLSDLEPSPPECYRQQQNDQSQTATRSL